MSNITSVQEVGGQFSTTIPKAIALALDIKKGTKLEWKLIHGELVIRLKG